MVCFSFFMLLAVIYSAFSVDPDCTRDAAALITSKGYPAEQHEVVTRDGYILGLQRIPHARDQFATGSRQPVLLQHGLEGSSTNWISNYRPNQSLGFILADAGYDVWLGNSRGNVYSRRHTKYNPKQRQFWKFSWDQMAEFDIPATIDYILNHTGFSQIYYVAHSQGTLIGFAQFSKDPETARKVKMFFALAPIGHVGHISSPLKIIAPLTKEIDILMKLIGYNEFLPSRGIMEKMAKFACVGSWHWLCNNIAFLLFGHKSSNMNQTRLPVYVCHNPAGTSSQNMAHFGEMVETNKLQMFDYGSASQNKHHYGQTKPPTYNPGNLAVKTVLFTGGLDPLADPRDVSWLIKQISPTKNLVARYHMEHYSHLDFTWGLDAPSMVYSRILAHMADEPIF